MNAMLFLRSILIISVGTVILPSAVMCQTANAVTKEAATAGKASKPVPQPTPTSKSGGPAAGPEIATEEDILPYYDNYLREYRLGPSDRISVEVFGQCPDYCKTGITIPPTARISYPLIREGVFVAGKTVEQVAAEITAKLDEYIIEPKVTVTLDRAMATRYSVMGNVASPGVRVMDRRVSVYEAIIESGGVTKKGDRNKIYIVSYTRDGRLARQTVSLAQMESGKAEMVYLKPGDQVFVAGKGFTIEKIFDVLGKASAARFLFGSPF